MIYGIGTDIIEIDRIRKSIENPKFLARVFTENEVAYASGKNRKHEIYAGFFSAKEAVSKAFGTGFSKIHFKDIEIIHDEMGKPCVKIYREAEKLAEKLKLNNIFISISHSNQDAIAFCVIERE